jgi:hypothetical protein
VKISKRTREQAAIVLAVGASTIHYPGDVWYSLEIDWNGATGDLARAAIKIANRLRPMGEWHEVYAEAESLLRCGWSPK